MAEEYTAEQVSDEMFKMVKETAGKKNLKAGDLRKAMIKQLGGNVDRNLCKKAIRELIESGRCVYSYFGGSYITIPRIEGSNPDAQE